MAAKICLREAPPDGESGTLMEVLSTAYDSLAKSQRKIVFRCREGSEGFANFDTFAFNSSLIRNVTLSLQKLLQFDSLDPSPVIVLPDTSPDVIGKVESLLQTGTCTIRDRNEALEILDTAAVLGLPISKLVPENWSGVASSSPIILSNVKVKTEVVNPETFSTIASSEVTNMDSNSLKGYKCAICKRSGGNLETPNRGNTIFQKEIQLEAHYIGQHFTKEIGEHIKGKDTCGICGKIVVDGRLPLHIGLIHKKIKSILKIAKIPVEPSFFPKPAQRSSPEKKKISSTPSLNISPRLMKPSVQGSVFTISSPKNASSSPSTPIQNKLYPHATATPNRLPQRELESSPAGLSPQNKACKPKDGSRKSPEESRKKTSLPKPTLPVHLTSSIAKVSPSRLTPKQKKSGASHSKEPGLLGKKRVSPRSRTANPTPDKSRRDSIASILSNCETPSQVTEPTDEFVSKYPRNCNYELKCEICDKAQKTPLAMELHTIAHFKEDVEAKVSGYMTGDNKCKICGDSFKTKNWLITHLGSKHGYINKVLLDKGFGVLPCPVNSTGYTASKQQQLMKIKAEKIEFIEEEQVQGLRDELTEETGANKS